MPLFVSFRAISSSVSTDSTMCGSISVAGVLFILVYVFESDLSHELEGAFRQFLLRFTGSLQGSPNQISHS